jgi:hypothetical protein
MFHYRSFCSEERRPLAEQGGNPRQNVLNFGVDFNISTENPKAMKIHFLWWEECPSHPGAWQRLLDALQQMNLDVPVERIEIRTDEDAERWHFPGSPTIQVDGQDIDPNAAQLPARLTCRLYFKEDGRPSPLPSLEMIMRALEQARNRD